METFGMFCAAAQAPMPGAKAASLKGITDFANRDKNDKYREYAAYTCTSVLSEWVSRYL
jgi:hypothetical protein